MIHRTIYLSVLILTALLLNSCGDDTVTPSTNNSDCGSHHDAAYGPFVYNQHTNNYESSGIRTFQFSAIPFTTIDNICTHGKPHATGSATWFMDDTTRPFLIKVVVSVAVGLTPYSSTGTYTQVTQNSFRWDGDLNAGLQQTYGNGPGSIIDFRIEVSFRSFGNLQQDEAWLQIRGFTCNMNLAYDEYRAQ